MSERLMFNIVGARSAGAKITRCGNEIQNIHKRLNSALSEQSTPWWIGNSKNGYTKRVERLLAELKTASETVAALANDLQEIVKNKEEEEQNLSNQLSLALSQGGRESNEDRPARERI